MRTRWGSGWSEAVVVAGVKYSMSAFEEEVAVRVKACFPDL